MKSLIVICLTVLAALLLVVSGMAGGLYAMRSAAGHVSQGGAPMVPPVGVASPGPPGVAATGPGWGWGGFGSQGARPPGSAAMAPPTSPRAGPGALPPQAGPGATGAVRRGAPTEPARSLPRGWPPAPSWGIPQAAGSPVWQGNRPPMPGGPGTAWSAAAAPRNPRLQAQVERQSAALARAAEDMRNASLAFREHNEEQVAEILAHGAREVELALERPRNDGEAEAWLTVSGAIRTPIVVPAAEPTPAREREALERAVREGLRGLYAPYCALNEAGAEMTACADLARQCREAVNSGQLRQAVLALNALSSAVGELMAARPASALESAADGERRAGIEKRE